MRHPVVALIVPEGVIVLAFAALLQWPSVLEPAASFLPTVPIGILVLGLALAARFGRSRVFFALLVLVIADRAILIMPEARNVVGLLVPINLMVLGLAPERGFLSTASVWRSIALLVQVAPVAMLAQLDPAEVSTLVSYKFLPASLTAWTPLADPAIVSFAVSLFVFGGLFLWGPNATARGFFWVLAASLISLSITTDTVPGALAASTFMYASGAIVLGTAMIEASHDMAYRDGLTGLPGRRALDEALSKTSGAFTIAMVDVDHFKKCNDTYGHESGDQVLRMIATVLGRVGSGGRAYRYGGEEFSVVFPGRDLDSCLAALETLRANVEATTFTLRAADRPKKKPKEPVKRGKTETVTVTVSMGVAERRSPDTPPDDVISKADDALYKAKKAGRNRIVAVTPGQSRKVG